MASVKTNTKFIFQFHTINNFRNFLKTSPNFRTFPSHRLKCHSCFLIFCQNFIQSFNNFINSNFCTFSNVSTWMKNNPFCPNSICSFNLCSQKLHRNLKSFRLYSIPKINYIRSMHNNIININIILLHKFKPSFNIQFFNRLSPCILRCSSINHKSIRSIRNCFLNRSQKHIFPTHSHV